MQSSGYGMLLGVSTVYLFFAVCGTTGKRKACKDCSCGLAEELDSGNPNITKKSFTSSCGSVSVDISYNFEQKNLSYT